jgi:hypothetical protein
VEPQTRPPHRTLPRVRHLWQASARAPASLKNCPAAVCPPGDSEQLRVQVVSSVHASTSPASSHTGTATSGISVGTVVPGGGLPGATLPTHSVAVPFGVGLIPASTQGSSGLRGQRITRGWLLQLTAPIGKCSRLLGKCRGQEVTPCW